MSPARNGGRARVVIIGGGFGGLNAARALANTEVDVTLVDRNNYHLFQPLLYQVATGTLSPANIARPLRVLLRRARNIEVRLDEIERIDFASQMAIGRDIRLGYDFLILATGARHAYFGHPEWEALAPGLKDLPDAIDVRRRIICAFERAESLEDPAGRAAALTFVIVGGGPTGVEMAGAIAEVARFVLRHDFDRICPADSRILLIDGSPRLLCGFPEDLSAKAKSQIEQLGVEVRLNTRVSEVTEDGVLAGEEFIPAETVIWAAGNSASPLGADSRLEVDQVQRVIVRKDLTAPGHPKVFVVGDAALFEDDDGRPLPGVSPVAIQQGRHAARNILRAVRGESMLPFRYLNRGSMAVIGRRRGVADLRFIRFGGPAAWYAWLLVHLVFLVGFRHRILVVFLWFWAYITWARDALLMSGSHRVRRGRASRSAQESPS